MVFRRLLARFTLRRPQSTNSPKADKLTVMNKGKKKEPPPVDNSVSDSTGQYDLRFLLWRQFCAQYSIPVDTLPSQLDDDQKDKWEEMKARRLK